jgi:hypothetical protein
MSSFEIFITSGIVAILVIYPIISYIKLRHEDNKKNKLKRKTGRDQGNNKSLIATQ